MVWVTAVITEVVVLSALFFSISQGRTIMAGIEKWRLWVSWSIDIRCIGSWGEIGRWVCIWINWGFAGWWMYGRRGLQFGVCAFQGFPRIILGLINSNRLVNKCFECSGASLNCNGFLDSSVEVCIVLEYLCSLVVTEGSDKRFELYSIGSSRFCLFQVGKASGALVDIISVEVNIIEV